MKTFSRAILILAFILIYTPAPVKAQVFSEGDNLISVGYGFGVLDEENLIGFDEGNGYTNTFTGPFYLKYEHALTDRFTIGINMAFAQYTNGYTDNNYSYPYNYGNYTYEQTYTTFSVLARLNWHFGRLNKFDPYWGFGVGYRTGSYSETTNDPNGSFSGENAIAFPLGFEITIGARYYLTDRVAIYMETGLAKSVVQAGLTFKLK